MSKEANTEHLRAELKSLADTLEEVLSTSGDKSKEELSKLRSKAEKALQESRYRLGETGDAIAPYTYHVAGDAHEREKVAQLLTTESPQTCFVAINPFTGSEDKDFSREQVVSIVELQDSESFHLLWCFSR